MSVRRAVTAIAVFGALTACATTRSGSPAPGNTRQPSTSTEAASPPSASPSSTQAKLPPRPRELDVSGVDPCTDVLTGDQLRQLVYDLGYLDRPRAGKSSIHGGPNCLYGSSRPPGQTGRDISSLIAISTSEGAQAWLTDPRRKDAAKGLRIASVAGFPTLVIPHPFIADSCDIVVDVHEDQYLEVNSSPDSAEEKSPDRSCAEAQRVAELVIQNLSAR